ncbi:MAG TPA: phosphatase PAP2 family protein [Gaiellaceae bacterium]|jgi:undecaprenyl-diphosphatase|nr:phosphatase PAP2 family protein [Gaiellaceae bacterium]
MPVLLLFSAALAAGGLAGLLTWRYPRQSRLARTPSLATAAKVGEAAQEHRSLRHLLDRRLDPESATGLALSLALLAVVVLGIVLGLLAYLVRTSPLLISIDNGVAKWGARHASAVSTHILTGITQLGSIEVVIGLCAVLAFVEWRRTRGRWILPFIVIVMAGEELASTVIKDVVDRTRPAFNPAAASLGPSFPSGHTTTAAAFYAAAALLLGRRRPRAARALISGTAVGITVAVASSRVLLDVHWLTDVIGGLALGWAWFAICAVAFGGRVLEFGTGAAVAEEVVGIDPPRAPGGTRRPSGLTTVSPGTRRS